MEEEKKEKKGKEEKIYWFKSAGRTLAYLVMFFWYLKNPSATLYLWIVLVAFILLLMEKRRLSVIVELLATMAFPVAMFTCKGNVTATGVLIAAMFIGAFWQFIHDAER